MTEHADATVRASGLWEYLDCAYRAQQKALHPFPASVPAAIGTAIHASTGTYDQGVLDNAYLTVDDAAGVAVDMLSHPTEEMDWSRAEMSHAEAERRALWCHTKYCSEIAPTRTYLAVEETLEPLVVRLRSGVTLELTGHVDRRRVVYGPDDGEKWQGISDIKTGARAVNADGTAKLGRHGPQLGVYELLTENSLGEKLALEPEIIGLQTGGESKVGVATIPNAMKALIGTEETPGFLDYVGDYFRLGRFPPNPGSILCSPKYCPCWDGCVYHD